MRLLLSILIGTAVTLPAGVLAQSSGTATALLGESSVRGGSIYLSDLLPLDAAPDLRNAARAVLLGRAPEPGSERLLTRAEISEALRTHPLAERLEIPAEVMVRRTGRLITREEALRAIREVLEANHFPQAATLRPDDVYLAAPIVVHEQDAQLEVVRMDLDPALEQVCFLLLSRREPTVLPFLVTVRAQSGLPAVFASHGFRPGEHVEPASLAAGTPSAGATGGSQGPEGRKTPGQQGPGGIPTGRSPRSFQPTALPLVMPGKPAKMRISDSEMQMMVTANPLERGLQGQTIRVKLAATGKIVRAVVVGPGYLEASF